MLIKYLFQMLEDRRCYTLYTSPARKKLLGLSFRRISNVYEHNSLGSSGKQKGIHATWVKTVDESHVLVGYTQLTDVTRLNFFEVARAAFFSKYSPRYEITRAGLVH